jgi:hypothetical protein
MLRMVYCALCTFKHTLKLYVHVHCTVHIYMHVQYMHLYSRHSRVCTLLNYTCVPYTVHCKHSQVSKIILLYSNKNKTKVRNFAMLLKCFNLFCFSYFLCISLHPTLDFMGVFRISLGSCFTGVALCNVIKQRCSSLLASMTSFAGAYSCRN